MTVGSGIRLDKAAASVQSTHSNTHLAYAPAVSATANVLRQCVWYHLMAHTNTVNNGILQSHK